MNVFEHPRPPAFAKPDVGRVWTWSADSCVRSPTVTRLLRDESVRPQARAFLSALICALEDAATLDEFELAELVALAGCAPDKLPTGVRERFNAAAGYDTVHPIYGVRYAAELLVALARP
jgi:hypothetical protein